MLAMTTHTPQLIKLILEAYKFFIKKSLTMGNRLGFFLAKLQGCEKCGAAVTKSMWNSKYKTKKMKPENFQNSKND